MSMAKTSPAAAPEMVKSMSTSPFHGQRWRAVTLSMVTAAMALAETSAIAVTSDERRVTSDVFMMCLLVNQRLKVQSLTNKRINEQTMKRAAASLDENHGCRISEEEVVRDVFEKKGVLLVRHLADEAHPSACDAAHGGEALGLGLG